MQSNSKLLVADVVSQNFQNAALLDSLGISFFEHEDKSLHELCCSFGIEPTFLGTYLREGNLKPSKAIFWFPERSAPDVLEHLCAWHKYFVHQKLPYMQRLVTAALRAPSHCKESRVIANDLNIALPLFNQDFIEHIEEEEKGLFAYINCLHTAQTQHWAFLKTAWYIFVKKLSIKQFGEHHLEEDDCMKGIRELTSDYKLPPNASLALTVLYAELQDLEAELLAHAQTENDILMPLAADLEAAVLQKCARVRLLQ